MSFTIKGSHTEGTQFITMARVVGTDGTLLNPESGGPLTIEVFLRSLGGPLLYSSVGSDSTTNGLTSTGQTDQGWTQQGVWNFRYVWSPAILAAGSPPFAFKAPKAYLIRYTFNSPVFEAVKVLQYQTVAPG